MTKYIYGPWTERTGDECPVDADTLCRVWLDGHTKEEAEATAIVKPRNRDWRQSCNRPIRFYQICTPVEELWQMITGSTYDCNDCLYVISGVTAHPSDTLRIMWPYIVVNGKRVPDFTRQPKWEPLK